MTYLRTQFHRHARRIVALALLGALYLLARLPDISNAERQNLARQFRFDRVELPAVAGPEIRSVRPVHPSLQHISAWISSVGAGVALNDLDGDGLANDLCYVDVRTDQVIVAPVPGTGARYAAHALDAGALFDRRTMAPMGCLPGDIDEDGRTDLLVYYWGRTPVSFLRRGAGYAAEDILPGGERWFTNAATFADLDGDGHADLIAGNYFEDGSRVLDASATDTAHMQHSMSQAYNGGSKRLMLWQNGKYCDIPGVFSREVTHGWTLAIGAQDLDGDLLPEIYFGNDFGPDRLLHNRSTPGTLKFELAEGARSFAVPKSKTLGHDSFKGMGVDFGDLNGDGWPDLFVSNIAAPWALEESHFLWMSTGRVEQLKKGIAPYIDRGEQLGLSRSGWGWDARLTDLNNDGTPEALQAIGFARGEVNRWPELHEIAMGNDDLLRKPGSWHNFRPGDDLSGGMHNPFYARARDGRFYDVARELGMDEAHISRGIAVADVDGDGRLDYAVANQWESSQFYHNQSPDPGKFLGLRVRRANGVPVIGVTVTVHLADGRKLVAQADGGSGHSGKRSPEIHFGLGKDDPVREEVRWRDQAGLHSLTLALGPGWHTVVVGGKQ